MFAKEFIKVLEQFPEDTVFVDLFGGSGLLSHIAKRLSLIQIFCFETLNNSNPLCLFHWLPSTEPEQKDFMDYSLDGGLDVYKRQALMAAAFAVICPCKFSMSSS